MNKTFLLQSIAVTIVTVFAFSTVSAQGPVEFFKNIGKNVEADPQKEYKLTEKEGPYLIFAVGFTGPTAKQDAHTLVLELRKTKKWNAYVHEMNFVADLKKDFSLTQTSNPHTGMGTRYKNPGGGTEVAVLIGNFSSLDDKQFEKVLDEVRNFPTGSLKNKNLKTPFTMAFAYGMANPMLPPENQRGVVDAFVASLNKGRPYSLLQNPRRYTVQIATFTGTVFEKSSATSNKLPSANAKKMTDLEKGEQAAVALCEALRKRGIEAYEFHDRYASIVTVGSFDEHSHRMPNGTTMMNPQIQQIILKYQARMDGNTPKITVVDGIECDPKPVVIEVPRSRR